MTIIRGLLIGQLLAILFVITALSFNALTLHQQQLQFRGQQHLAMLKPMLPAANVKDIKPFVALIKQSMTLQQLSIKTQDGVVLHQHNHSVDSPSLVKIGQLLTDSKAMNWQLKDKTSQLELSFVPDYTDLDNVLQQELRWLLLSALLLSLPAFVALFLLKGTLTQLSARISQSIEKFMRDPAATQNALDLPAEFESVDFALGKFSQFSQQQYQEMARAARQVADDAARDSVTQLPNRNRFVQYYEDHLRDPAKRDFGIFAIIRCTELNSINQARGYQAGDQYVCDIADILKLIVGTYRDSAVYRLNSSDFGILLPRVTVKDAENFAATLNSRCNEYQQLNELDSVAYAGLVAYESGRALGELLASADTAISLAQTKQNNGWHIQKDASNDLPGGNYGNQNWRHVIDDVLNNNRLTLLVQQIQPSTRSSKTYSEILVRFKTQDQQMLPTAAFFAMAEKLDRIIAVDRLIIETALHTIKQKNMQDHSFGINLSPRTVHDEQFIIWLERRLLKDQAIANRLIFEVSEYGLQQNLKTSKRFIDMLHRCGARLTVEKFGIGITSFKFFRDLKPDFVKMDGSYTRQIDEDKNNQYFMRLMIDLAHRIGVAVFAESVETQEEKHMLESLFIDGAQGYYIGKPQPL